MKGTLYTSYFSRYSKHKGNIFIVSRTIPEWLNVGNGNHLIDLSPSHTVRDNLKNNKISVEEFTSQYYNELMNNSKALIKIDLIRAYLENGEDVTLYCYETNDKFCHRILLANLFKNLGYITDMI